MRLLSFDIKKLFFLKNEKGASLHFRLFLSFISMLFAVFTCILILLFVTGVFHAGTSEMLASFETELTHLSDNMSNDYGNVSIRGIALSEVVANEIEEVLKENNIRPSNLSNHPEIINTVLNRVCSSLVSGLIQSEGSCINQVNKNQEVSIMSKDIFGGLGGGLGELMKGLSGFMPQENPMHGLRSAPATSVFPRP
jgi:hypothetical protein